MMFFRYRITLYDPLYYAREGLFGAYTPQVLHGTCVNHAVTAALALHAENQPFVIAETNGGMDVPRYSDSRASPRFYFTPAGLTGTPRDWSEIAKGDNDGFLFRVKAGEILKATQLHFVPPETEFLGLGLVMEEVSRFPERIRLGSFRGVGRLDMEFTESAKPLGDPAAVDHPVDPLLVSVRRGLMLNLFPYPVVQNAFCDRVYELRFERPRLGLPTARFAWPSGYPEPPRVERARPGPAVIV
jgi:hypothetical protein